MEYSDSEIEEMYPIIEAYAMLCSMCDRIDQCIYRSRESQSRMRKTDIEINRIKNELGLVAL